jgi:hypothetical protein
MEDKAQSTVFRTMKMSIKNDKKSNGNAGQASEIFRSTGGPSKREFNFVVIRGPIQITWL